MSQIVKTDFWYGIKNQNRMLHIYLPDDYENSQERYPVMYFFDGHNLFYDSDATYGKSWGMKDFMDHWDKKMILVGMECSHDGDDRLSEYCPYDKRMFGHWIHGIGEDTFQWIICDIKPYIDNHYRTYGHREATGIGGSSMGGIMSLYGVMKHNNIFSKAACLSTGVYWNLASFQKTLHESSVSFDTRVYLSWGEKEAGKAPHGMDPAYNTREARAERKFEKELQNAGVTTYLYFQPDGEHCEADWEKQDGRFMDFLWQNRYWQ